MARSDAPELLPTYEAAAQIRERALRRLDSLFVQGSAVWSVDAVGELHARFVENPDTSADSFENKLRRQLEGASPGAIQLMAELLYVHLLMASDIKGSTKRRNISTVLSWSESPSEIPLDLDAALDHGFAHAGMGFRSKRPTQISFLIEFTRDWVGLSRDRRDELLEDPWEFKAFVYGIPSAGSPESQRNALLYLAHPDTFENIVSQYHKRDITEAFGELAPGLADIDRALLAIRQQLDSEAGESVNFYEEPFVSRWQGLVRLRQSSSMRTPKR